MVPFFLSLVFSVSFFGGLLGGGEEPNKFIYLMMETIMRWILMALIVQEGRDLVKLILNLEAMEKTIMIVFLISLRLRVNILCGMKRWSLDVLLMMKKILWIILIL